MIRNDVVGHAVNWRCYDFSVMASVIVAFNKSGGRTRFKLGMSIIGRLLSFTCARRTRTSMWNMMVRTSKPRLFFDMARSENLTSRLQCWALIMKRKNFVFNVNQKLKDSEKTVRVTMFFFF